MTNEVCWLEDRILFTNRKVDCRIVELRIEDGRHEVLDEDRRHIIDAFSREARLDARFALQNDRDPSARRSSPRVRTIVPSAISSAGTLSAADESWQ